MLKLFLWLRYLRKKKIVLLSIAAVALSVALMIVVDSLFTGYIDGLEKSAVSNIGDIFVWTGGLETSTYEQYMQSLETVEGIHAVGPLGFSGGLLYLETGDVREVTIQGIDASRDTKFADWKQALVRQSETEEAVSFAVPGYPQADGCWLGINVVAEPDEMTDQYDMGEVKKIIGKTIVLTTTGYGRTESADGTGAGGLMSMGKRRVVKFKVADVASTRTYFGDKTLYIPISKLSEIVFGENQTRYRWRTKIKLAKGADVISMMGVIRKHWEEFARNQLGQANAANIVISSQQDEHSSWLDELHKQLAVLLLIFGVICSVAVLLIFCIFYMIVEAKLKDIAIMRSCGASRSTAWLIFAGFGSCVGIVGSGIGIILGYVVTSNISVFEQWVRIIFKMKLWRSSSYMLNMIPNQVNWSGVWLIILVAVSGCILGALIPAIVAARVEPVKILRYE